MVLACIDKEDTPRSLIYQLGLLRQVGFADLEVLLLRALVALPVRLQ